MRIFPAGEQVVSIHRARALAHRVPLDISFSARRVSITSTADWAAYKPQNYCSQFGRLKSQIGGGMAGALGSSSGPETSHWAPLCGASLISH